MQLCNSITSCAYLQPYGFRFQLSRFLRAEHQCLLRRLATWQLLRRASSTLGSKPKGASSHRCPLRKFFFFAFCNLQFCSSDEFRIPDCISQNATWHVFCFCNLQSCKSMNSSALGFSWNRCSVRVLLRELPYAQRRHTGRVAPAQVS